MLSYILQTCVLVTWANRRVSDLALVVGKLGKREESRREGVKRRRVRGTYGHTCCTGISGNEVLYWSARRK